VSSPVLRTALVGLACAACGGHGSAPRHDDATHAPDQLALDLTRGEVESLGLRFVHPEPMECVPEVRVFGRVVHDPAAVTSVVAPYAGRLSATGPALALGMELGTGVELFRLEPRWTPQERADLAARRAGAAAERAAAEAELPALRAALERARRLNAADEAMSNRELEETESRLHVAEARAAGAQTLESALDDATQAIVLCLPRGGTLLALDAHDGQEVEAGRELLRVEDLSAPLLQLDLPPGKSTLTEATRARVELAPDLEPVPAMRVGLAPDAGGVGTPSLLFRLEPGLFASRVRPGQTVRAWLAEDAPPRAGVCVPRETVVRVAGSTFVYAREGESRLRRVPVTLDQRVPGGWFVAGLDPGVDLVVEGASSALSFELLGRQQAEEED